APRGAKLGRDGFGGDGRFLGGEELEDFFAGEGFVNEEAFGEGLSLFAVFQDDFFGFLIGVGQEEIDFAFGVISVRLVVEFLAHAPVVDHFAGDVFGGVEVAIGAVGHVAHENVFGGAAAHEDGELFDQKFLAVDVLVLAREGGGGAEGVAARDN